MANATAAKKNLKPLAAVDFFSKISDFFSTAAKVFLWMPKKWRTLLR